MLDDDGRCNFAKLGCGRMGSHYYAFDILMFRNDNLRGFTLVERKPILKALVSRHLQREIAGANSIVFTEGIWALRHCPKGYSSFCT